MGPDQTYFIDLFHLEDVTNKLLQLAILLRVSGLTPYVTGKEVASDRNFFTNM